MGDCVRWPSTFRPWQHLACSHALERSSIPEATPQFWQISFALGAAAPSLAAAALQGAVLVFSDPFLRTGPREKAVFQWKRAVSGPSALLGPEMVRFASNFCSCAVDQEKAVFHKFASNFCSCAVDQEKAVFQWKRVVSGDSAPWGPCRPRKGRFSMETGRFWPICPFGARNGQICIEFLLL